MGISNNTATEIRDFSAGNLYSGDNGTAAGGNVNFLAAVLVRPLGPAGATEYLWSNRTTSPNSGWAIARLADNTPDLNFTATVTNNSASITAAFVIPKPDAFGRLYLIVLEYVADDTDGVVNVYVNGGLTTTATATQLAAASSGSPDLGGSGTLNPATHTAILAAAYTTDFSTVTSALMSNCWLESIKRCAITSVTSLDWEYNYDVERDAGYAGAAGANYPRTLVNYGTSAPAGDLDKVGSTAVTVGSPFIIWGTNAGESEG